MGKKRRLLHSKKFARKHDNHPRMKMLNPTISDTTEQSVTETTTTLNLQPIVDEIMAEASIEEVSPEVVAPSPTPRKRSTRTKTKTATQ